MSKDAIEKIVQMDDRSEAYMHLCLYYLTACEKDREYIRSEWEFHSEWEYPDPSRLACKKGEKYSSEDRVIASLLYHSINAPSVIHREDLIDFGVLYNSCIYAGLDADKIFERVAAISTRTTAKALRDFGNRSPDDRSLDAFMLKAEKNSDGEWEISNS